MTQKQKLRAYAVKTIEESKEQIAILQDDIKEFQRLKSVTYKRSLQQAAREAITVRRIKVDTIKLNMIEAYEILLEIDEVTID